MILMPSRRVTDRLVNEPGGVWIDASANEFDFWLVAKLRTNLIREIDAGIAVDLRVWVVDTEGGRFAAFGLTVHDSAKPEMYYGACRLTEEIELLRELLTAGCAPIQFHNETELPYLSGLVTFDATDAAASVAALPTAPYPSGDDFRLRCTALDIVKDSLAPNAQPDPRICVSATLPLTIENCERLNATVAGVGKFTVDDNDQGTELEKLTFLLLDRLFPFGVYHSPERDDRDGRREVCDVLAVSRTPRFEEEGLLVIQNKVATVDGVLRTPQRRARSIEKNIFKGLKQAIGAIRQLKDGVQVYQKGGQPIEVDPPEITETIPLLNLAERANQVGHGIVLVSELHPDIDGGTIWTELAAACRKTGWPYHILDLMELHQMALNANGDPAMLENYLLERWKRTAAAQNALVRFRFIQP